MCTVILVIYSTVIVMNIKKEQVEKAYGVVVESMPNTTFKVRFGNNEEKLTYLSGKMRKNRIKVVLGDKVTVELDKYGGKGRIIKRN